MSQRSFASLIGALMLACGALALGSVTVGSTAISPSEVWASLRTALWQPGSEAPPITVQRIVVDLRMPRTLLALAVGAGLALAGMLLQTVTRNGLADPFLFGLSSGAAAGAVFVITVVGDALGRWTLPVAAFAGGLLAAAIALMLSARSRGAGPERIVLAGLAVSFLFAAITHAMVFAGDQRAAHSVLFWSLGGLGLARWDNLGLAYAGLFALLAFATWRRHALDALLAGDDTAHSLGIDPSRMRRETFIVAAFATASFVALSGVIGFVGLMVPHLARALAGPLHGRALPLTGLLGALLLLASDTAGRSLLAPQELPVGIVTASLGALFVMALLWRREAHDPL